MIHQILSLLKSHRFLLHDEKQLQGSIEEVLVNGLGMDAPTLNREVVLDEDGKDIIDFMIEDIGIEVKIHENKRKIFKQCERYCNSGRLKALILFSNTSIGMPVAINGVDIYVLNPSRSWL